MPGGLIRLDLARAWELYFGQKGGQSPRVGGELLPVVMMDDTAAYPPFRRWEVSIRNAAAAANYSYCQLLNNDPLGTKSVVVVERIILRCEAIANIIVAVSTTPPFTIAAGATPQDMAEEKDQAPTDQPRVGNVVVSSQQAAGSIGVCVVPYNDLLVHELVGPWSLGAGALVAIRPDVLNVGLNAYFRGRYYPQN